MKSKIINKNVIDMLEQVVGKENVSTSIAELEAYSFVSTSADLPRRRPDVVVLPETAEQVANILKYANRSAIPVLVRGAGTGFVGENIPLKGGILLDITRMGKILEIDEKNMVAIVEGGCTVLQLFDELDKRGLAFPVRTWFMPNMTMAGLVANNGTGDYSCSFGRVGGNIEGLEILLANGEMVRLGSWAIPNSYGPWTRFAGGPDMLGLFVGSIGALGIITKVAIRLINKRKFIWYQTFGWPREEAPAISRAMYELQRYGVSSMSIHNSWTYRGPSSAGVFEWPTNLYFSLNIIQTSEDEEELKVKEKRINNICKENKGVELGEKICKMCQGPPYYLMNLGQFYNYKRIKGVAKKVVQTEIREGLGFMMFYHCCPTLRFNEYWDIFEEITRKYGFLDERRGPYLYGWFFPPAVINPFPTFAYKTEDQAEVERARQAHREISKELLVGHGFVPYQIGSWQPREYLQAMGSTYKLLKKIKKVLDPKDILNPGQI